MANGAELLHRVPPDEGVHLADLLVAFLEDVKRRTPARGHLCLGGTLFSNSHFNARVKLLSGFEEVFVPVNPGDAGGMGTSATIARGNGPGSGRVPARLQPAPTAREATASLSSEVPSRLPRPTREEVRLPSTPARLSARTGRPKPSRDYALPM